MTEPPVTVDDASVKKKNKKQRQKEKKKAAGAEAAAAAAAAASSGAAAAAAEESKPPSSGLVSRSSSQNKSSALSAAAGSGTSSAAAKPYKRKFSATPPASPSLYALTPERAAAASGGSAIAASVSSAAGSGPGHAAPASSLLQLVLVALVGAALFAVTRSLLLTVVYGASGASADGNQQVWSVTGSVYVCSVLLFVYLLRAAFETHAMWAGLVLELSNQLDKYLTSWELLAVDDAHQLLAAINQVQQLLDAALASFAGLSGTGGARERAHALAALDFAVQTMDFLHLAHRNLISELGSTQPIMRLVASLGTVRTKLMHVRSKLPAPTAGSTGAGVPKLVDGKLVGPVASPPAGSPSNLSPLVSLLVGLAGLNILLLLSSPPLSSSVLNVLLPLGLVLLLCALLLFVWAAQYPFQGAVSAVSVGGAPLAVPFPCSVLSMAGISLLVSLEPLHYLRARLGEKEAETQQRVEQADREHPQQQAHQHQQQRLAAGSPVTPGSQDDEFD